MITRALVEQTIERIEPRLSRLRRAVENRKPKEIVPPERLQRRTRFAAGPGVVPTRVDLERILGDNDLLNLNYLERGLRTARAVARIIFVGPGDQPRGYATGFMVSSRLLLTNHHVFRTGADAEEALLEFDYELDLAGRPRPTERFRLRPQDYFYSHQDLDFALVAVNPKPLLRGTSLEDYGWLVLNPVLGKINAGEYVSIIQHPGGEPKQISVRENQLVEIGEQRLVYLCDTAPGSSGSPVFNDAWQVVGLHHSGVPARDKQGRWLGPDGQLAPPNAGENQIKWIANEGIRISSLVECFERSAPRGPCYDELLATTTLKGDPLDLPGFSGSPVSAWPTNAPGPRVRHDAHGVVVSVPVSFRLSWEEQALTALPADGIPAPNVGVGAFAASGLPPSPGTPEEARQIDPDFSARPGYQADFLGIKVPLPTVTAAAMRNVARRIDDTGRNNHLIPYHHFSIVMNAARRLCFFAASNYDHSASFRGQLTRRQLGSDHWGPDPRLSAAVQIKPEEIYDATPFDLGHVVMRENNFWGSTQQEAVYANWDTFFLTNCTPQHADFNRENRQGHWGKLEAQIAGQLERQSGRLSIFAGPVLSRTDKLFRGVPIPKQYWKVIVANTAAPAAGAAAGVRAKLRAWGFLLSQEKLIRDLEADFQPGPFATFQVPLAHIEKITQVRFAGVVKRADVKAGGSLEEAMPMTGFENLVVSLRGVRPGSSIKVSP